MPVYKNITESQLFPAASLLKTELPLAVKEKLMEYVRMSAEEKEKARPEVEALVPAEARGELVQLGVTLPSDLVKVNIKLGMFLYDLFLTNSQPPKAPLAAAVWKKKAQELALVLNNEEFGITDEVKAKIQPVLNDESMWGSAKLTVWVELPENDTRENKPYIPLTPEAVQRFFPRIMSAALSVFMEQQEENG